jgi:hypothetical protein
MEAYWGSGGIALASTLDSGEWSVSRPGPSIPRERAPRSHGIGGWVGPRAVLCMKCCVRVNIYKHGHGTEL